MSSPTWDSHDAPPPARIGLGGWVRIMVRALPIIAAIVLGLFALIPARLIEKALGRRDHGLSAWVTVWTCRVALGVMGLRVRRTGAPMTGPGAMVANHTSWLDIFVLNSGGPIVFVSKAEVAGWPGIGWLARATGTLFIARDRRQARAQTEALNTRLRNGERPLFFPEGTSTDGLQVLPFKAPLFEAFLDPSLPDGMRIQPVSVRFHAPERADTRTYGWWGNMGFGPHLLSTLALSPQGHVDVVYHAPIPVSEAGGRKALAARTEAAVRRGHAGSGDP
ncbi:MAG: lysophospholipid acyltransferase family protein [Pseudomonadota bacterium]